MSKQRLIPNFLNNLQLAVGAKPANVLKFIA